MACSLLDRRRYRNDDDDDDAAVPVHPKTGLTHNLQWAAASPLLIRRLKFLTFAARASGRVPIVELAIVGAYKAAIHISCMAIKRQDGRRSRQSPEAGPPTHTLIISRADLATTKTRSEQSGQS